MEKDKTFKVGDKIMFAKHGGKIYKHAETDEDFVLIQDRDVLIILEEA